VAVVTEGKNHVQYAAAPGVVLVLKMNLVSTAAEGEGLTKKAGLATVQGG
jgi:hypothetical protein